jgi:hypothetical protein
MQYAAYNEEGIWGVAASAADARAAGEKTLREAEATDAEIASLATAPVTDELVAAIAAMESGGPDVAFDLEDGVLVVSSGAEDEAA